MVRLLVDLGADRLGRRRVQRTGVVPGGERARGASAPGGPGAGGGIAPDQSRRTRVAHPRVRRARRRPHGAAQTPGEVRAAPGRRLPDVLHGRRRHHGGVPVLVRVPLGAVRLRARGTVIDGVLLAFGGRGVELAGRRDGGVVRGVLRRPRLVQGMVVVVLAGGVGGHAEAQGEGPVGGGRRRALVVVVGPSHRARALVVVAPVEAALFKIRVHNYGVNFGGRSGDTWTKSRGSVRALNTRACHRQQFGKVQHTAVTTVSFWKKSL